MVLPGRQPPPWVPHANTDMTLPNAGDTDKHSHALTSLALLLPCVGRWWGGEDIDTNASVNGCHTFITFMLALGSSEHFGYF